MKKKRVETFRNIRYGEGSTVYDCQHYSISVFTFNFNLNLKKMKKMKKKKIKICENHVLHTS